MHLKTLLIQSVSYLLYLTILLSLLACNHTTGSDNAENNTEESGEIVIGITDAEGDFLGYTVTVESLLLTHNNGQTVETTPISTPVDFAQYTQLTEFFTAATIPAGRYTEATMRLNYSEAQIVVDDGNNQSVTIEKIQDVAGNEISSITMKVQLIGQNQLIIAPGVPAHLSLDFDLKASNSVIFDPTPSLTVEPLLIAQVNPEKPKIHRLRGPLISVDTEQQQFQMTIRPFRQKQGRFGSFAVTSTDSTLFEIDGESYDAASGLNNLSLKSAGTAVKVFGSLLIKQRRFEATEVYAGSSVENGSKDVVSGNVIALQENQLTLRGATLIRADGTAIFNHDVNITVDTGSQFTKPHADNSLIGFSDINIGQHITALGKFSQTNETYTLDATGNQQGIVRLRYTTLRGNVVPNTSSEGIAMSLQTIDGRSVSLFDFSSGKSDPNHYQIDTTSLLAEYDPGTALKVRGFMTANDTSETFDFTAKTLIDVSNVPAHLNVTWQHSGTTTPFTDDWPASMTLNLTDVGRFHHLVRSGVKTDINTLSAAPTLSAEDTGLYVIKDGASKMVFTLYANFKTSLQDKLAIGKTVKHLASVGHFDETTSLLSTQRIRIRMNQ